MKYPMKSLLWTASLLAVFGLGGSLILAITWNQTESVIAEQERNATLKRLAEILPDDLYDNDPLADAINIAPNDELRTTSNTLVWRAKKGQRYQAWVFNMVAEDGYAGPIRMLVSVHQDGTVLGVRIVQHKETPGLGDGIETKRSDWVLAFSGRSLNDPKPEQWNVKKDGGIFDQFTGATITPRAVVTAVKRVLEWSASHREQLIAPVAEAPTTQQNSLTGETE